MAGANNWDCTGPIGRQGTPRWTPSSPWRSRGPSFRAGTMWLGGFIFSNDLRGSAQEVVDESSQQRAKTQTINT